MEIALSDQFLAPVPLGRQWWNSLSSCQKICLAIVIVLFTLAAFLSFAAVCADEIYVVRVVATKIEEANELPKTIPSTGVIATRGFWRWNLRNVTNSKAPIGVADNRVQEGHFQAARDLLHFCISKSSRLGALLNITSFFALISLGISMFFFAFLVLFRVHFLLAIPLTLLTSITCIVFAKMASVEQLSCLDEVLEQWGRNSGGVWLLRSRLFESSLSFNGASVKLVSVTIAMLLLPASTLAIFLVAIHRKHL